ncbi:MAG: alpha/beta hydrolase [Sandaracinaceae bacterium]|nr:alpha/beta hydrolase [Sandaracinaceae bacterium]
MHLSTAGSGPDLVLIPGAPQHPSDLEVLAEPLRVDHRVTIVHLPGYGETPRSSRATTWSGSRSRWPRPSPARASRGPSWAASREGSYRALQLALDASRLELRGLFLMGPFAHLEPDNREGLRGFGAALEAGIDLMEVGVARMFSPTWAGAHPERARAVIAEMMVAADRRGIRAELAAFADSADLRERLGAIRVPVALRVGELDLATPPASAREIAARVAGASLDVVPGAGHMIHHEDREGTLAALRALLARA